MGQTQCCQRAYQTDQQTMLLIQKINLQQPIQSDIKRQQLTTNRTNKNFSMGKQSNNQGYFINKIPDLNQLVKQRILELHAFRMQGSHVVQRGIQEHGYFKFKKTGIVYLGQWKNQKPHGYGKYFYPNGQYYQGSFIDGVPHGKGRFIRQNGDFYQGDIKFGRANGDGYYKSQDGQYRGAFKDNVRHGYGQQKGLQLYFKGIFQYGQKKQGVLRTNEDIYEGQFQNDQYDGQGKLTTSEGIYTGSFRNGLQHGYGVFKWNEESIYRGNYYNGVREGDGQFFSGKNNSISRGFWKNGILNGEGQYIQPRGSIHKCIWSDGKIMALKN